MCTTTRPGARTSSLCIVEFEGGAVGLIENSWARRGGMDDRVEVYGEAGLTYANLHMGNALPTYSETGYGYAVEKAPTTKGWTYPVYEELWNYGFPQEMHHFARCVRGKEEPIATGEDGRTVLEALLAGYQSARIGAKVGLPFRPSGVKRPIDLWLGAEDEVGRSKPSLPSAPAHPHRAPIRVSTFSIALRRSDMAR